MKNTLDAGLASIVINAIIARLSETDERLGNPPPKAVLKLSRNAIPVLLETLEAER